MVHTTPSSNQNDIPEEEVLHEESREVVSRSLYTPQVEPTLEQMKQKLHEIPEESPYNKALYAKLENDLFDRFAEFDKAALTDGIRTVMQTLLAPENIHAGTPLEAMLRRFVFEKAEQGATPNDFMIRMLFLEQFLFHNVLCVDVPAADTPEKTERRLREAKDSAQTIFLQEKRRADREGAAYTTEVPEELRQIPPFLEEPVLVVQTTDPVADEEYTRKRIYNYQLNRDSRISLFARQVADHMAHLPETGEYFGMTLESVFHPRMALPEVIQGVVPPDDNTLEARERARQANAGLGLSADMLEYALDRQLHVKMMDTWFSDTTHGENRRALFRERILTNQAQQLWNAGFFQKADPALHNDVESILRGDVSARNNFHRERLQRMQETLAPLLPRTTPPPSLRERQPGLMSLVERIHPGTADTMMEEWHNRLYGDILQRLPDTLQSGAAAVQKLATLDVHTAIIPQDLSPDDARTAIDALKDAAVGQHEIFYFVDTIRRKRTEFGGQLQLDCEPALFSAGAHQKIDQLMEIVFRQPEATRYDVTQYSSEDQKEIKDLGLLRSHGAWLTDSAKFQNLLYSIAQFRQVEGVLQDVCDHFCTAGTSYLSLTGEKYNKDLFHFEPVFTVEDFEMLQHLLQEYEAKELQGDDVWKAKAIIEKLDDALHNVMQSIASASGDTAELMLKQKELELLRERMEHGYLTPQHLESIISDPSIATDLKPQSEITDAFREEVLAQQVDKSTELAMDFLDRGAMVPEGLEPGKQSELDDLLYQHTQKNSDVLEKYLKDREFASIQDTLANISEGALKFKNVEEAEKAMNDLCRIHTRSKGMPDIPKMRIGEGAWYHIEGTVQTPATGRGKKKQPAKTETLDFFSSVHQVSGKEVQLRDRHGPWLSLEEFVFHVVNTLASPEPEFKMRWVFDAHGDNPPMNTKEALIEHGKMNEDFFEEGFVIKRGEEPYARILGSTNKGVKVQYTDKDNNNLGNGLIPYTEYYLHYSNAPAGKAMSIRPYDPLEDEHHPESPFKAVSLKGLFHIGKAIFENKTKQLKDFREIRTKYQMLYWFKQGGKSMFNKHSIWLRTKNDIISMEDEMAKSYLEELKSKQSSQIRPFVRDEMRKFRAMNLNKATSGSPTSDFVGITPINKHRAEFITLMVFLLEKYGALYPFEELEEFRIENFWLKKLLGTKEENELGRDLTLKNKGAIDGEAEIWRVVGQMRARPNLYGDVRASKVESAYESGKDARTKHKEKELSMKQTTPQVQEELGLCLKRGDWAGIVLCFRKMAEKNVSAEDMFNCFLYFYVQMTRHGVDKHKLPPMVPVEELKKISTTMFQSTPDLYFFLFKGLPNIQYLDDLLMSHDPEFYKTGWSWDSETVMPKPTAAKTRELYRKFTMTSDKKKGIQGDYSMLNGYSTDDNNYVKKLQGPVVPTPFNGFNIADDDKDMWKRNNLLFFNEVVLENFVYKNIGQAGMENATHSVRYLEGLLDSLEDLIASNTVNEGDKQAFLNKFKAAFFKMIYGHFNFRDQLDQGMHISIDQNLKRDYFMNTYYPRLKSMGFTVDACAKAADSRTTRLFVEQEGSNIPVETVKGKANASTFAIPSMGGSGANANAQVA